MTKKLAQGLLSYWCLQSCNHPKTCVCGKTPLGVATAHFGKTEEEYNQILELAGS